MTYLTIVQLYPDELGVAGDRGNVMALRTRLENAGQTVTVVAHEVGSQLPTDIDLLVVGSGPLSAMRNIHQDLMAIGDRLRDLRTQGMTVFAYGSGAELLGRSITLQDGTVMPGLEILPFSASRVPSRAVGYIAVDSPFGRIVGFEDNASTWTLEPTAQPLGLLEVGVGNGIGSVEGVQAEAAIGTQIGGPVLPLNPVLTDAIIDLIATRRGFQAKYSEANARLDSYAANAREVIITHSKHVFSRI